MRVINEQGITAILPSIKKEIANKNEYSLVLLEENYFLVSKKNAKIGFFSDANEAVFYYLSKADPDTELNEVEEAAATKAIERLLKGGK